MKIVYKQYEQLYFLFITGINVHTHVFSNSDAQTLLQVKIN